MYACCHTRHPESGLKQERLSVWLQKVKLSLAGQIFKLVKSSSSGGNALKKKTKKHPHSVCSQPTTTVSIHYLFFAPY